MDLLPYTEYSFRVAAVTVAEGPYTAELVARTAEDGMECFYESVYLQVAAEHIRWRPYNLVDMFSVLLRTSL